MLKFFKARRQLWLSVAFALLWLAFPLVYLGGTGGSAGLTAAGLGLVAAACVLCVLAGK